MIVDSIDIFEEVLPVIISSPRCAIDVETNGLDAFGKNQLCGVGIATSVEDTYYFPFRHQQGQNLPFKYLKKLLTSVSSSTEELLGYNLKFDLRFLENDGLVVDDIPKLVDVIVMVRLTEPSTVNDLSLTGTLKRSYGESAASYDIDTKKIIRSNKWKDYSMAPPEILGPYCEKDVEWTYRLFEDRYDRIVRSRQESIYELQCKLTRVLYAMECRGITIDNKYATKAGKRVDERMVQVEQEIYELVGKEFSIQSTKQVGEIFNDMGIHSPVQTPGGKESWSEAALISINHKLAGLIRQYRSLGKLKSTYIDPYIDMETMHTSFCNWGALTGRLSSRSPNLQNIPRNHVKLTYENLSEEEREEVKQRIESTMSAKGLTSIGDLDDSVLDTWGFIGDKSFSEDDDTQVSIRRIFVPRPDYTLIAFDYSQMEVRVFLDYLNNDEIKKLLHSSDVDFHAESAKLAFHVDESAPDFAEKRQLAKNITFGTIYGIGVNRLSIQLNTSLFEARKYKRNYFEGLKGSKEFIDGVMAKIEDKGETRNKYGRVYKIPADYSYKGVNYLVQGTAADILNERMLEIHEYLKDKKSNILLQVHDEIICEIHEQELSWLPLEIKQLMQENSLNIPLVVDMEECSPSWATKRDFGTKEEKIEKVESFMDLVNPVENGEHFISIPYTDEMIELAHKKAKKLGVLNDSIRKGEGNFVGYLGELAVAKYIGAESNDTYNNDLKKDGVTIEVKTKECTSKPTLDYEASIAKTSRRQKPDVYMFARVEIPKHTKKVKAIWLCGQTLYADYFEQAKFLKQGENDPQGNSDWFVKRDCYNLPYGELSKITANSPNDLFPPIEDIDNVVEFLDWGEEPQEDPVAQYLDWG